MSEEAKVEKVSKFTKERLDNGWQVTYHLPTGDEVEIFSFSNFNTAAMKESVFGWSGRVMDCAAGGSTKDAAAAQASIRAAMQRLATGEKVKTSGGAPRKKGIKKDDLLAALANLPEDQRAGILAALGVA